MLIVFGTGEGPAGEVVSEVATCPYCSAMGIWLQSYTTTDASHVYGIPVGQGAIRIVHKCSQCQHNQCYLIGDQPLLNAWAANAHRAREHIAAGDPQVVADVALQMHLGDYPGVQELLHAIEQTGDLVTAHIARGRSWQLCGNFEWAEKHFQAATEVDPPLAKAHFWLGRYFLDIEGDQAGIAELQRAKAMDSSINYLPLLVSTFYMRKRNTHWAGVECIGEEILRLDPQVEQDRATMKTINKARRKLGRNPYQAH